jgi:signal transduction histidine kinase
MRNRPAKKLVEENRSVTSRLSAVLDAAHSGIFGMSNAGEIVFANAGARHMLGGLNIDLPTKWPENIQFLDSEDLTPLEMSKDPIKRALAGQTIKGETTIMSRLGSEHPRYTRVSSAPLARDVSPGISAVVLLDDVSEQEMNRQQVERAGRLDALGQLTGGIAHDFNNLLAAIKYSIQLADVATDDDKRQEYNEIALKSVRRGANLTQRLLAFAKRQPGIAKSREVEDIVSEMKELMVPTIEENFTLEFIVEDPGLWVFVDVAQLENAMLNLVLNARDAIMRSGKGNRIVVKARSVAEIDADMQLRKESADTYIAKGLYAEHARERSREDGRAFRYVEFSVTDNGPGMDEETKRRAIDPFFTTKASNSGTGLGLSMVYGFIQQADGEMRI